MRLGIAIVVAGRALSERADHGGLEFAFATRFYRGPGQDTATAQPHRRDCGYERVRSRTAVPTHRFSRDVRAYGELARIAYARALVAHLRRPIVSPRLQRPPFAVPL